MHAERCCDSSRAEVLLRYVLSYLVPGTYDSKVRLLYVLLMYLTRGYPVCAAKAEAGLREPRRHQRPMHTNYRAVAAWTISARTTAVQYEPLGKKYNNKAVLLLWPQGSQRLVCAADFRV